MRYIVVIRQGHSKTYEVEAESDGAAAAKAREEWDEGRERHVVWWEPLGTHVTEVTTPERYDGQVIRHGAVSDGV